MIPETGLPSPRRPSGEARAWPSFLIWGDCRYVAPVPRRRRFAWPCQWLLFDSGRAFESGSQPKRHGPLTPSICPHAHTTTTTDALSFRGAGPVFQKRPDTSVPQGAWRAPTPSPWRRATGTRARCSAAAAWRAGATTSTFSLEPGTRSAGRSRPP